MFGWHLTYGLIFRSCINLFLPTHAPWSFGCFRLAVTVVFITHFCVIIYAYQLIQGLSFMNLAEKHFNGGMERLNYDCSQVQT